VRGHLQKVRAVPIPTAEALLDSTIAVGLVIDLIVVPAGMPEPETYIPGNKFDVLIAKTVTFGLPAAVVPVLD
jgi:hypothetical protein